MTKIFKGCEVMDAQELDGLEMYPHNVLKTSTYYPLPHFDFYNNARKVLEDIGIGIVSNSFGLTPKRDRMFMWLETDAQVNGLPLCIGGRNSYDKSMSAGLCVGTKIMVCSNKVLASYENGGVVSRKHTSAENIDELSREFSVLVSKQTTNLISGTLFNNLELAKDDCLADWEVKEKLFDLAYDGIICPTDIKPIWNEYRTPRHPEFYASYGSSFGLLMAATEVFKLHKGADYQIKAYDGVAKALGL
jgi:hypothetical protein